MFRIYLCVGIGSALGGMARYWFAGAAALLLGEAFPWGTILINILGSFVIGVLAALTGPDSRLLISPAMRQFAMAGLCGGFTTFSAFSLQTLNLARDGDFARAGMNVILSVILGLIAVWAGFLCASSFNHIKGM